MGGDITLPLAGATVLVVIGVVLLLKGGSKWGLVLVAAAAVWGWYTMQPTIKNSQARSSTPEQGGRGYYRKPAQ
jgi:hypothetical protein